MQNNKFSDLKITVDQLDNPKYKEITIGYPDHNNTQIYYRFQGTFTYELLDSSNVLIIETEDMNHQTCPRLTIFSRIPEGHRINSFPIIAKVPKRSAGLRNIKKIIIPGYQKYFVYSYEFGIICSACYDQIQFDEETKTFDVSYHKSTEYGEIKLTGTLDSEGHLIDDTLYFPDIRCSYLVDEHNLDNSIEDKVPKIERDIAKNIRKQKANEYATWENECYLKRKKGLEK